MLIIERTPLINGAHRNQQGERITPPEGWAVVPSEMETEALSYLPFIALTLDGEGEIAGVAQGTIPPAPPMPQPEPTPQEDIDAMLIDHEYRLTLLELGNGAM